jgi:Kef-type K+ transport system membrane component KefB
MDTLIDLALLLFGAKVGGIIFSKLRQPSVMGELIAGIILGPSLLSLVNNSSLVEAVSHLGLLFLILLVSLGIDWKLLEGNAEKYISIEFTRIIVTVALVYIAGSFMGWNVYTLMLMAFIIILSSTAIVARTLADLRVIASPQGQTLMGLEVVDEVVAIVSVALLANMMNGAAFSWEPIMTTVLLVVGLFVVMNRVGFKLVNRVTSSIQKYGIEEALLGFTLLLAFVLGSITESLSLASILGVFVAGMILSRSAQAPIVTRKVKEIGESFFVPIFFASVGLTINMFAALQQVSLIALLVAAILAIKAVSATSAMRFFGYSFGDSTKVASGFISLSEMTIVMAALAVTLIEPGLYVSIIAAFVIISAISPVVIGAAFRSRPSKDMMMEKPHPLRRVKNRVRLPSRKKYYHYPEKRVYNHQVKITKRESERVLD